MMSSDVVTAAGRKLSYRSLLSGDFHLSHEDLSDHMGPANQNGALQSSGSLVHQSTEQVDESRSFQIAHSSPVDELTNQKQTDIDMADPSRSHQYETDGVQTKPSPLNIQIENHPFVEHLQNRKLPIFRNLLQMPGNRLRMVQKRTQRVKSFIGFHRRSFSGKLRLRNRRDRIVSTPRKRSAQFIIPADHPFKILFDLSTVFLTLYSVYAAHVSIRDRSTYEYTPFVIFNKLWFLVDIVLNFFTAYQTVSTRGMPIIEKDARAVWARYLTSWFAIDILSLIPWERLYLKPVIEMQNKRNLLVKSFFRTKAVIRVSTFLRGWHFKYFGKVAHNTKHIGVNSSRLLTLIIKYAPKYLIFYRNMKGVLIIKTLRLVHFTRKAFKAFNHLQSYREKRFHKNIVTPHLLSNTSFGDIATTELSFDEDISAVKFLKTSNATFLSDRSVDKIVDDDDDDDDFEDDDGLSFRTSEDDRSLHGDDSWSELVSVETEQVSTDAQDSYNDTSEVAFIETERVSNNDQELKEDTFDSNSIF